MPNIVYICTSFENAQGYPNTRFIENAEEYPQACCYMTFPLRNHNRLHFYIFGVGSGVISKRIILKAPKTLKQNRANLSKTHAFANPSSRNGGEARSTDLKSMHWGRAGGAWSTDPPIGYRKNPTPSPRLLGNKAPKAGPKVQRCTFQYATP